MSFALNLIALLIVVGLCWFAMVWYAGRFDHLAQHGDLDAAGSDDLDPAAPCSACDGLGATSDSGKLAPCGACHGTGVGA